MLWIAMFLSSPLHPDTSTLLSGSEGNEPLEENIVHIIFCENVTGVPVKYVGIQHRLPVDTLAILLRHISCCHFPVLPLKSGSILGVQSEICQN